MYNTRVDLATKLPTSIWVVLLFSNIRKFPRDNAVHIEANIGSNLTTTATSAPPQLLQRSKKI